MKKSILFLLIFVAFFLTSCIDSQLKKCENTQEANKIECFGDLAIERDDVSVCSEIETRTDSYYCMIIFAESKEDTSICDDMITRYEHDTCYEKIAIKKKDASICDSIQSSFGRDACPFKVITSIARDNRDETICNQIVSQIYEGQSQHYREQCISSVALEKNDITLCHKITSDSLAADCYTLIATLRKDVDVCNNIEDPKWCINYVTDKMETDKG